jgi:hypothetical protein
MVLDGDHNLTPSVSTARWVFHASDCPQTAVYGQEDGGMCDVVDRVF